MRIGIYARMTISGLCVQHAYDILNFIRRATIAVTDGNRFRVFKVWPAEPIYRIIRDTFLVHAFSFDENPSRHGGPIGNNNNAQIIIMTRISRRKAVGIDTISTIMILFFGKIIFFPPFSLVVFTVLQRCLTSVCINTV